MEPSVGQPRAVESGNVRIAVNRERQRALYGSPLGDRIRGLTAALGITQARLAGVLGMSPAMLSQLVSARRVKIGDPAVLARLVLLDRRCAGRGRLTTRAAEAVLDEVARAQLQWGTLAPADIGVPQPPPPPAPRSGPVRRRQPSATPAEVLRTVAAPARLAAAAAALAPAFPELAQVLRQAAARPR